MEQEERQRQAAFRALIRDVGKQLGKPDRDSIEVYEKVPEGDREKGGIKLLEHLQKNGKFSLWRTGPLREILRNCDRFDLADGPVKEYQLQFTDTDSPKSLHHSLSSTQPERCYSSHPTHHQHSRSSPVLGQHSRAHHSGNLNDDSESLPTLQPLTLSPQQEMGTSGPQYHTLPGELRGSASSCSLPSHYMRPRERSFTYVRPVQEKLCTTATSSPMQMRPYLSSSCDNCHENQLRASALAIEALYKRAKHSTSSTSIHSDKADHYRCDHSGRQSLRYSTSFTIGGDDPNERTSVFTHRGSYVVSDEESATSSSDKTISEYDVSPIPSFHNTPSASQWSESLSACSQGMVPEYISTSSRRIKLPRPLSGARKQAVDNFTWIVKRERLLKALSRPSDTKFRAITCSQKVDLDIGQGKNNPKLILTLYPNGLFSNEGKSASLQAKIVTPDKCPPLPPSLRVQLNVTAYDSSRREKWNEVSVQETVNMYSFYIHNLIECDRLQREEFEMGDFIQLGITVQIRKATDQ